MTAKCPKCGKTIRGANSLWNSPTVAVDPAGKTKLPMLDFSKNERYKHCRCPCGEDLYIFKESGSGFESKRVRVLTWAGFRAEGNHRILERRNPENIKIHSLYSLDYGAGRSKISSTKRTVKNHEYVSPHVRLRDYFSKHIGRECVVLEGKASLENWDGYEYRDVIVLALEDQKGGPSKSELKAKEAARQFVAETKKRLKKARSEIEEKLEPSKN